MALMMGALYEALREARVPDQKAKAAAEEVASYEARLNGLSSDVRVLTWITGATFAGVVSLVVKAWLLT
ncbi:MAG TPA: hypothetical protein VHD15_08640 [Hyphomicrobiales bacterium]|nr:hypothetical protein [Hyphomicrobiales bacterium]